MRCVEAGKDDRCSVCGKKYKGGELVFRIYNELICGAYCGFRGSADFKLDEALKKVGALVPAKIKPNLKQKQAFDAATKKAKAKRSKSIDIHISHENDFTKGFVDPLQKVKDDINRIWGE